MTDLIVTRTEARRDFFNLYKIAESGKRRIYVNGKKSMIEFVVKPKKVVKKFTWDDVVGNMSDKDYKKITKILKELDKLPARATPQW
jgi:hypothetical protein